MKKLFLLSLCLLSALSSYAENKVFMIFTGGELGGTLSGNMNTRSSYALFETAISPVSNGGTYFEYSGTTTTWVGEQFPSYGWIGIGSFIYNKTHYCSPLNLSLSSSLNPIWPETKQHVRYGLDDANAKMVVTLGSSSATETDFIYKNDTFSANLVTGASLSFVRDKHAAQKTFTISIAQLSFNNGTFNFGAVDSGALTLLSSTSSATFKYNTIFNLYTNLFKVTKGLTLDGNSQLNLIIPENALSASAALLQVGEVITKGGNADYITLDFSNSNIANGTYMLISSASSTGFDLDDTSTDFIIKGLEDKISNLSWNTDGNILSITIATVPEAASIASLLGLGALFVALIRKRK